MRTLYILLLLTLFIYSCEKKVFPKIITLADTVTVKANYVDAAGEDWIMSDINGIVQKVYISNGDSLEIGQLLVYINNDYWEWRKKDFKNTSENFLTKANELYIQYKEDSILLEEATDKDVDLLKYKASESFKKWQVEYNEKKQKLDHLEKLLQKEEREDSKKQHLKQEQKILATRNSKLVSLLSQEGAVVKPGSRIGKLAPIGSECMVSFVFPLEKINDLKEGQEVYYSESVLLSVSSEKKIYRGSISRIYRIPDEDTGQIKVEAILPECPTNSPSHFFQLELNIPILRIANAIMIPKKCLIGSDSIEIADGWNKKKILIKKGIEREETVQIIEGVSPGNEIIVQETN